MLREIKGTQRLPRVLAFRMSTAGVLAEGGSDAVAVRNGAGDYTLTFTKAFLRVPCVTVGVGTANIIHQLFTLATGSIRVKTFLAADGVTATDSILHINVLGWDTADTF